MPETAISINDSERLEKLFELYSQMTEKTAKATTKPKATKPKK